MLSSMEYNRCLLGDCRESMRELIAGGARVQTCITSPPYWGLRDYGTASWEGGRDDCNHKAPSRFDYALSPGLGPTGVQTQASNAGSELNPDYVALQQMRHAQQGLML